MWVRAHTVSIPRCRLSERHRSVLMRALFCLAWLFALPAFALPVNAVFTHTYYIPTTANSGVPFSDPGAACSSVGRPFRKTNPVEPATYLIDRQGLQLVVGDCFNPDSFSQPPVWAYFECPAWAKRVSFSGICYVDEPCVAGRNCKERMQCDLATPHPISIGEIYTGMNFNVRIKLVVV